MLTALAIFAATYLVLAIGRLPGFRVDRTGAAIIGASLMLAANVLTVADARHGWLTLAMASTLAGNLTLLGSVANLIVVQRARHQVEISFREYARAGVPLTIVTLAMGVWLLG